MRILSDFRIVTVVTVVAMAVLASPTRAWADLPRVAPSKNIEWLTQDHEVIWGFDWVSPNEILFSERTGSLQLLNLTTKKVVPVKGAPAVWAKGQGGLLDVRTLPHDPKQIFLTYSVNSAKGGSTALMRSRWNGSQLTESSTLLTTEATSTDTIHFGSRIEFDGKDYLWFTVGDRNQRDQVQKPETHYGKILRLKWTDPKAKPEVWSLGHRSPQGLAWDPVRKILFESEMGPRGGDEINVIEKGKNYGWPDVTWGREYHGPNIGVTEKAGTTQPLVYWVPSISPSAITVVRNSKFKDWEGHLLVATLSGEHLRRIVLDSNLKVTQQIEYFKDLGERFRCVRIGPDGLLYFSTDSGKLGRVRP